MGAPLAIRPITHPIAQEGITVPTTTIAIAPVASRSQRMAERRQRLAADVAELLARPAADPRLSALGREQRIFEPEPTTDGIALGGFA